MHQETFLIISEGGLDVKTITLLVNTASEFQSSTKFSVGGRQADAKSIINLMALNVKKGQEVTIEVNGDDFKEAFNAIVNILRSTNSIQ
ncbi:HPr family phosphocarrier protein [Ureaplasma ceti]|uniref:HPr family phosphocarrier protein n=1 Tax=Ureaplasma ceti TaxID=3119530 RepID=A0ABP9U9W9_9BACT